MGDAAEPGCTVGGRIAQARLMVGAQRGRALTQTELGRQVGVAPATVSQWEAGASIPTLATFEKIALALGVRAAWLAFGEEATPPAPVTAPHYGEVVFTPKENAAPLKPGAAEPTKRRKRGNGG